MRHAVRYQIKYGAKLIKVCASGGVMSLTGTAGAQHYSDEELRAIVDEAHRRGMRVAAHAHGDQGIRAAVEAGIDCIEHASLMSEETQQLVLERGTFIVPTSYLSEAMDTSKAAPELQAKAAEVFPIAKKTIARLIEAGAKIATGTDARPIPHGQNAKELWALVERGMRPRFAIASRDTLSLPAARLRAHGGIIEIGAEPALPCPTGRRPSCSAAQASASARTTSTPSSNARRAGQRASTSPRWRCGRADYGAEAAF